jgi:NADH-ubiquinone oxidoreductase chain 2
MSVITIFQNLNFYHLSQFIARVRRKVESTIVVVGIFSLGGIPPLLGFVPKWLLFQRVSSSVIMISVVVLIFTGVITLYFYLRVRLAFIFTSYAGGVFHFQGKRAVNILFMVVNLGGLWVGGVARRRLIHLMCN